MQWLFANWVWVLLVGAMVAMHLFGHRRRGSRGAGGENDNDALGRPHRKVGSTETSGLEKNSEL